MVIKLQLQSKAFNAQRMGHKIETQWYSTQCSLLTEQTQDKVIFCYPQLVKSWVVNYSENLYLNIILFGILSLLHFK